MNIFTLLEMAADTLPDRVAVTDGEISLDFAGEISAARAAAAMMRAAEVAHVAYLDINTPAAPVALFGAALAGKIFVPLNYRLSASELQALVERIAPALVIMGDAYRAMIALPAECVAIETGAFMAQCVAADAVLDDGMADDDDLSVAVQIFTSGTTGQPKAALLRHANLTAYILGTVEFAAAEEDDATLIAVPPYHIAGISAVLSSTYAGRRMVQLANFDAAKWIALVHAQRVSNVFVVPTMLARILEQLELSGNTAPLRHVRSIAYGGGKMPGPVIEKAISLFPHIDFTNAYGLTETSSTIALLGPDDHREAAASADAAVRRRLFSVGRALPSVEIEIRDDEGRVLGAEESGLVFVRGEQVAGEYREQGNLRDAEGWFPTRDRGYLDHEGYLFLDGRADDVIVRGGENISPGEIEDVLHAHAAIEDVAAVAIPDQDWGEAVGLAVVVRAGAEVSAAELRELIKSRLRSSKVPRDIKRFSALPYNETGKCLRRVIRDQFSAQPDLA